MATYYANHLATLAAPSTRNVPTLNVHESGGRVHYKRIQITAPATANNDLIRFCSFKTNDCILSIKIYSDDVGAAGTLDLGLYLTGSANDGALVSQTLFASAVDINTAALSGTEIMTESGTLTANLVGKRLWEAAAQSSDPGGSYDLVGRTPAGIGTGGNITLIVTYGTND